jgi:hypothetical protein
MKYFVSDNVVCVHDMTIINFPTVTVVQRTRGATLFTLDIKVSNKICDFCSTFSIFSLMEGSFMVKPMFVFILSKWVDFHETSYKHHAIGYLYDFILLNFEFPSKIASVQTSVVGLTQEPEMLCDDVFETNMQLFLRPFEYTV